MPIPAQETEDMKVFKQRLHSQIKDRMEPLVRRAKQELLDKMKQCRDDKAKQQQCLQEYNDAIWNIDQVATDQFKDEFLREKIRRSADGAWGDHSADRSQSRASDFVSDFTGQSENDWSFEALAQQKPTSASGHNRSKSQLGNNTTLLNTNRHASSRPMYGATGSRSNQVGMRPNYLAQSVTPEDSGGLDDALAKFAAEQARLERAHSPVTPLGEEALRKFTQEQARLHRAHSPEISRNDAHSKFAEEQARLNRARSPDLPRNEARTRTVHTPTNSADSARLAAFAEQQLRAHNQYAQENRKTSGSRLGQNSQAQRVTPSPAAYVPTIGRRSSGAQQPLSLFNRFPLNERDDTTASQTYESVLTNVEVLFFDLDETVLDWQGTVAQELRRQGNKYFSNVTDVDWEGFAMKWKEGYLFNIRNIAERGESVPPDTVYRTVLDQLLAKEEQMLVSRWTTTVRDQLVEVWNRCQAWPNAGEELKAMKEIKHVATFSNLCLRTQAQMSRDAGLSWDACLSGSLLGFYKPDPEAYKKAANSMNTPEINCAMVSTNLDELRVASSVGMKTVLIQRPSNSADPESEVLNKLQGGEVDVVVESFGHLAIALGCEE